MYLIGIDEAGRGSWAGPIFASLVIIDQANLNFLLDIGVRDSKKISINKRTNLANLITQIVDFYIVESLDVNVIDKIGIHQANKLIIQNLVSKIPLKYLDNHLISIDGRFNDLNLNHNNALNKRLNYQCVVDGDENLVYVSAASILAKVYRDKFMINLSKLYPLYYFDKHKGYGTKIHQNVIKKYGLSDQHRKSFKAIYKYLNKLNRV